MRLSMKKWILAILLFWVATNAFPQAHPVLDQASDIETDTTSFDGILSSADDTVQKALETIDAASIHDAVTVTDSDTIDLTLSGQDIKADLKMGSILEGLSFTFQSFGEIITAGTNVWKSVPYNCTVTGWDAISSSSGTTTVDILKSNYTDPTAWTSIAGSELPSITASTKNQDLNLTTWTVNLTEGDYVMANVTSTDVSGKVHVNLWGKRR